MTPIAYMYTCRNMGQVALLWPSQRPPTGPGWVDIKRVGLVREDDRPVDQLRKLLPELDDALEHLEMHGQHSDQGYRKLKDWYRKVALACDAIDSAV